MCCIKFLTAGNIYVSSPVFCKSRLTPINKLTVNTITRIELSGAKVAVAVARVVENELGYKFNKCCFWTDSATVLGYIKNVSKKISSVCKQQGVVYSQPLFPRRMETPTFKMQSCRSGEPRLYIVQSEHSYLLSYKMLGRTYFAYLIWFLKRRSSSYS